MDTVNKRFCLCGARYKAQSIYSQYGYFVRLNCVVCGSVKNTQPYYETWEEVDHALSYYESERAELTQRQ